MTDYKELVDDLNKWRSQWARAGEAADAIAALRAEVEALKQDGEAAFARATRIEGERDALRQDAERYRWLRDGNKQHDSIHAMSVLCRFTGAWLGWFHELDEAIDAAIDADRQEQPK